MASDSLLNAEAKMRKTLDVMARELATIRTGRATPILLDGVKVDYYGVPTPVNQLATISAPEAELLVIQPWDRKALNDIQKAILKSDLGLNPTSDGSVIRLAIPLPSEERRKELVKLVKKRVEGTKVALRNLRRESLEELRDSEKNKQISQDELSRLSTQLQKLTDSFIAEVEQKGEGKEAEIMEL
jgi:ribosome recycling factor